jgi:DNA-binding response OmpR family regulator
MAINKVLIIDDEAAIANTFAKQLKILAGFDVTIINSGKEALEHLKTNSYGVILLDLMMPEVDGFEILKTMNASPEVYKKTPVIILTNVSSQEAMTEAKALGALEFFIKTDVEPGVLIEAIKNILRR